MHRSLTRLVGRIWPAGLLVALILQPGAAAAGLSSPTRAATGGVINYGAATRGPTSPGATQWVRRYNGPGNGDDSARAVLVNPDGARVYVTGLSPGSSGGYDFGTVAYDASSGTRLWVARYKNQGNSSDDPYSLGVSPDGAKVYVTGATCPRTCHYGTVAYDASTGAEIWTAEYKKGYYADSLGVSPDGTRVFVTGIGPDRWGSEDYHTVAYDASTGTTLWVARYNGPGNDIDEAYSIAVSPDGSKVMVTGRSLGASSGTDYGTVA
jgi:DNA-binding beta-propeller fold protein YncE